MEKNGTTSILQKCENETCENNNTMYGVENVKIKKKPTRRANFVTCGTNGVKTTKLKTNIFYCDKCCYHTSNKSNYNKHLKTLGHMKLIHGTKSISKNETIYTCKKCCYHTSSKTNFKKHLSTDVHKNLLLDTSQHKCQVCGKVYKFASGLWKHRQKCKQNIDLSSVSKHSDVSIQSDKDLIKLIMEENAKLNAQNAQLYQDLQKQNAKHHENIQAIIPHVGNNNNNKEFNVNIFLNETCKDAMNIKDFVENIKITLDDVVHASNKGVLDSSRKLIVQGLKCMEVTERPIHCTDIKRNTMYIKDAGLWNKDKENEELKKILQNVSDKHMKGISEWVEQNPNYMTTEKGQQEYVALVRKITGGITDSKRDIQPTIKNICQQTFIE